MCNDVSQRALLSSRRSKHFAKAKQFTVSTVSELEAILKDKNTKAVHVTLRAGTYLLSQRLTIEKSVSLAAERNGEVKIKRSNSLTTQGNPVPPRNEAEDFRGLVYRGNGKNDYLGLSGIQFENLSQAIHIETPSVPNKKRSDEDIKHASKHPGLTLELRRCKFHQCFHGILGEHDRCYETVNNKTVWNSWKKGKYTGFWITGAIVGCKFTSILKNDVNEGGGSFDSKNGAIEINTAFKGLQIRDNRFNDVNKVAIKLGNFNYSPTIEFDKAQISNNRIVNVWENNEGTDECHGIFLWGVHMIVSKNHLETIYSSAKDGVEGIYCKVRGSLNIRDNVLIDAGGRQAMIVAKAGDIPTFVKDGKGGDHPECPGDPQAKTVIENNVLYKREFADVQQFSFPDGSKGVRKFSDRMTGIACESDNVTIRGNSLTNAATSKGGGLRINIPAGGNIVIEDNTIKAATQGTLLGYGIQVVLGRMVGSHILISENRIEGIRGKGSGSNEAAFFPAVGIRLSLINPTDDWPKREDPVTDIVVENNIIDRLDQVGGDEEFGVQVRQTAPTGQQTYISPDTLQQLSDDAVHNNAINAPVVAKNKLVITGQVVRG